MKEKICIFDIDGVLNNYPDCYVDFVNEQLKENFNSLIEIKDSICYSDYKYIKELYRTSGYKENLPVKLFAKELLQELKIRGYYIIILSSRPVDKYNELIIQTTNWLKKNNLEYDYLMFGEEKHLDIIQKFGTVEFIVEDNRKFANNIAKHGYKVYLLDNKYNQGETEESIKRIKSLNEIYEILKGV